MTMTLSGTTGIVQPTAAAPAFSAYANASQSIANNTYVKLQCATELFDTNSNYDNTNYRFTPTVAGYYQVSAAWTSTSSTGSLNASIYKNGSNYQQGGVSANVGGVVCAVNSLVYLNGSTDYIEFYVYQNSGSSYSTIASRSDLYYFQAVFVRS